MIFYRKSDKSGLYQISLNCKCTGLEWFVLALDNTLVNARPALILYLWTNWSVRNDLTHEGSYFSIEGSVGVIESTLNNLSIRKFNVFLEIVKGKRIIGKSKISKKLATNEIARASLSVANWNPLEQGWLKLNVDASFIDAIG